LPLQNFITAVPPSFLVNSPGLAIPPARILPCGITEWQEWKEMDAVSNWSLKALITSIFLPWQKVITVL